MLALKHLKGSFKGDIGPSKGYIRLLYDPNIILNGLHLKRQESTPDSNERHNVLKYPNIEHLVRTSDLRVRIVSISFREWLKQPRILGQFVNNAEHGPERTLLGASWSWDLATT